MMLSNLELYILLALPAAVAWLSVSLYRQYKRLSHIPGPRSAGFSKWWFVKATLSGRTHLDLYQVCEKYGQIARISPNDVVTCDIGLIRRMLSVRSQYTRSTWYNGMRFEPHKNNIVSMRDDATHAIMRSRMAAGYSGKDVDDLEQKIDTGVVNLLGLLDSYAKENRIFDFARKVQYLAVDVVTDLIFGETFGDLTSDADVNGFLGAMERFVPTLIVSTVLPWMIPLLGMPFFRPLIPSEHDVLGVGRIMGIAKRVVSERYGDEKKTSRDMLGSFVARGLTQEQAECEIAASIIAGSDTTATAIRSTMLYIMTNPRVLSSLQHEIQSSLPPAAPPSSTPTLTNDNHPPITITPYTHLRTMPYLQAVIKEGLRMHPPAAGPMSKQVPPDGDNWNGIAFPPGTRISLCLWGVFRSRALWGNDADEFRPERWLEVGPEKRAEMEAVWDVLFSAGKWACLGRNVAHIEMSKTIVELLRRFDFSVVDPTRPWKSINCGVFLQSEMWVRARRRGEVM
ncbi:hypothetical protein E4U30_001212 [Claviceps sp. LM220 group G6]|nr:hypothetical protein E4U30_001212 [Claviceps sp. LM220 group G6]KAG6099969.1 hypothetical protein E4U14_007143 [Claviceps sp. LM454 group G7]